MSGPWDKANRKRVTANTAAWRARNPEKVAASRKVAAPRQARWHKEARYGLTRADFEGMLGRQHGRCLGCNSALTPGKGTHVDHDHATGKVRGLLCPNCNFTVGHAKESRATMYQLAAYLELDRSRPVVYLVGSLRNPKVLELGNEIRALGIECVDNWYAAGERADDSWQAYSNARGRTYQEALESREARHVFHFDRAYLNLADAVVLLYPAGKSGHIEFGYAVGRGKRGYILQEEPADRYDVMLQFGTQLFHDQPSLLATMREELLRRHA